MKKKASFLCIPLILVACSSDSSSNATSINQESSTSGNISKTGDAVDLQKSSSSENRTILEVSSSSDLGEISESREIGPVDSNVPIIVSQQDNDDEFPLRSASSTAYRFNGEKTILFEEPTFYRVITAYYNELGVQLFNNDYNGHYLVTYRTVSKESNNYANWLWCNEYSHADSICESDFELFKKECANRKGEFVNDKEGNVCAGQQLWLSCLYPLEIDVVDNAFIDSVAEDLHSFAEKRWSTPLQEKNPSSSMSASSTTP